MAGHTSWVGDCGQEWDANDRGSRDNRTSLNMD
jgi:hypothetical protein